MCKRIFGIRASIKQLFTKYQIFTILPQISHFHKYRNFFKYICNFLEQLLHPYKFHGRDMSGILFFIFASCHPLTYIDPHDVSYQYQFKDNSLTNVDCYYLVKMSFAKWCKRNHIKSRQGCKKKKKKKKKNYTGVDFWQLFITLIFLSSINYNDNANLIAMLYN